MFLQPQNPCTSSSDQYCCPNSLGQGGFNNGFNNGGFNNGGFNNGGFNNGGFNNGGFNNGGFNNGGFNNGGFNNGFNNGGFNNGGFNNGFNNGFQTSPVIGTGPAVSSLSGCGVRKFVETGSGGRNTAFVSITIIDIGKTRGLQPTWLKYFIYSIFL